MVQEICWLQAIYGDPIVGASNPEQQPLLTPLDDLVRARVWGVRGGLLASVQRKTYCVV